MGGFKSFRKLIFGIELSFRSFYLSGGLFCFDNLHPILPGINDMRGTDIWRMSDGFFAHCV